MRISLSQIRDFSSFRKKKKMKTPFSSDLTIAAVRKEKFRRHNYTGNKLVKTLEHEFEGFGLYAQVCYTEKDGSRYYTTGTADGLILTACNKACRQKVVRKM